MPTPQFVLFDVLGILLWVGTFLGLGYLFSNQLEQLAQYAHQIGTALIFLVICGSLAGYLVRKYARRQQFLRQLRMARITPEELKEKLDAGEEIAIVDLRHPLDFLPEPYLIPGAIRMSIEELSRLHEEIPRDRDVVVYCTCPNEASSAMTALRLRQLGITRVRPLAGGYFAWRQRGLPLDSPLGLVPPPQKIGDFARKATPLSDGLL